MNSIGRFLQPKRLLAPALLFSMAFVMAAWFAYKLLALDTLSIGSIVLGLFFAVVGAASFAWVFPRGCKPCGALLEDHYGLYAPDAFDALAGALAQANPQTSAQVAAYRVPNAGAHRASIRVELCPRCKAVGVAQVEEQTYRNNQYWHTERASPEVAVTAQNVGALQTLCG